MTDTVSIRPMAKDDFDPLLEIVRKTGMFTQAEVEVAFELMDIWLNRPEQKDYIIHVAEENGELAGYVCYGPTPATEFTFDLYWIVVDPARQRRGIGKKLLSFAEKECCGHGGRLIIIETSSTGKYARTQDFYRRNGYEVEARIKDFYAMGDDRLIFTRRFR